jgi:L-ascorbate metabolism protein UlaG (beta-lactamase superfamily)
MKVTKFVHSCLFVETNERNILFDPGMMSVGVLDLNKIKKLDDVVITHEHFDHFSLECIKRILEKIYRYTDNKYQIIYCSIGKRAYLR